MKVANEKLESVNDRLQREARGRALATGSVTIDGWVRQWRALGRNLERTHPRTYASTRSYAHTRTHAQAHAHAHSHKLFPFFLLFRPFLPRLKRQLAAKEEEVDRLSKLAGFEDGLPTTIAVDVAAVASQQPQQPQQQQPQRACRGGNPPVGRILTFDGGSGGESSTDAHNRQEPGYQCGFCDPDAAATAAAAKATLAAANQKLAAEVGMLQGDVAKLHGKLQRNKAKAKHAAAEELLLLKAAAERHATVQGQMKAATRERDVAIGKLREASAERRQAEAEAAGANAELKVHKRKAATHKKVVARLRDRLDEATTTIAKSKGRDKVLAQLRAQVLNQAEEASKSRSRQQKFTKEVSALKLERAAQQAASYSLLAQCDASASEVCDLRSEVVALKVELSSVSPQHSPTFAANPFTDGSSSASVRPAAAAVGNRSDSSCSGAGGTGDGGDDDDGVANADDDDDDDDDALPPPPQRAAPINSPDLERTLRSVESERNAAMAEAKRSAQSLEEAASSRAALENEVADLHGAVEDVQTACAEADAELQKARAELKEYRKSSRSELNDVLETLSEKIAELTDAQDELDAVRARLAQADAHAAELKAELQAKSIEVVSAQSEATTLRKHVELSKVAVEDMTSKMTQKKGAVQNQRLEVVQATNELNALKTQYDDMQAYVSELKIEVEEARMGQEDAIHQADLLESDLIEVHTRLKSFEAADEGKEADMLAALEGHDAAAAESTKFERRMYDAEDERDRSAKEASELKKELATMRTQNRKLNSANARLEASAEQAAADGERVRRAASSTKAEVAEVMDQLHQSWDELADASAKKLALQTELGDTTHRLAGSEEAVARLHAMGGGALRQVEHCRNAAGTKRRKGVLLGSRSGSAERRTGKAIAIARVGCEGHAAALRRRRMRAYLPASNCLLCRPVAALRSVFRLRRVRWTTPQKANRSDGVCRAGVQSFRFHRELALCQRHFA